MPILANYQAFADRHWETGSIANVLAFQGVKAPHTGEPISEALLLGISGGITVGYFLFQYEGYDPHLALLTRNTFDPMHTIFDRLAIPQEVLQTDNPQKGEANLIATLESGHAAIVLADGFSLPYNNFPPDARNWAMQPIVVYGYEAGTAFIADRSSKPLHVTTVELMAARGRVKQDKFRVVALDAPDMDRLPAAVQKGIWQSIGLYTEAPPKGARDNWGLAALKKWAEMLTNTRNKQSWTRFFPCGGGLYSALAGRPYQPGAFQWICTWGAAGSDNGGAERGLYAGFLDEAAMILGKPVLKETANLFRASSQAWGDLAKALLPEDIPLLRETRELFLQRYQLFVNDGDAKLDTIRQIDERLAGLYAQASADFPLDDAGVKALFENLAAHVFRIHDLEREAVASLQAAMV